MPKVSVIIPVYRVEQYIEKCANSLFSQTLEDIEYIFVDDCSPDDSINLMQNVLKQHQRRMPQMRLIKHEHNQGLAAARTTGLKAAKGDYIIYCDSDDWVEPDFCKLLYETAIREGADIVACNYFESLNGGTEKVISHNYPTTNPKQLIHDIFKNPIPTFSWMHLIKKELFQDNNVLPFKGINSGEDLNVIFRIMFFAKKLVHVEKPLYHYQRRVGSLTLSNNYIDLWNNYLKKNITGIETFVCSQGEEPEFKTTINYLKFQKKMYLLAGNKPELKLWWEAWPESNKDIPKFTSYPPKTRTIFSLCSKSYLFLWLYFKVLRKVIK